MRGQEIVGKIAAELMDQLDAQTDQRANIKECIVIVLVDCPSTSDEEHEHGYSYVEWRCSDPINTHQTGLIELAREGMMAIRLKTQLENDDEEENP